MIKSQIRMMVSQGKSEDEIIDTFVTQYGESILAAPRASGFNLVAWIFPVAVALVAAAAIAYLVVRWKRRPDADEMAPVPVASVDASNDDAVLRSRLDEELKDFDK